MFTLGRYPIGLGEDSGGMQALGWVRIGKKRKGVNRNFGSKKWKNRILVLKIRFIFAWNFHWKKVHATKINIGYVF